MSRQKQLVKNTVVISIGRFSAQAIALLLFPLYTLYLTPQQLGFVDLVITYIMLLAPVVTIQMEMAAFRFLVDTREDEASKREVISNILHIVLTLTVALVLVFGIGSRFVAISYAALVLGNICAVIIGNLFLQIARGLGDNRRFAIASGLSGLTMLIITSVLLVGLKAGVSGVLYAMMLANVVSALYLFIALKLYRYVDLSVRSGELKKKLVSYSLPLVPNGLSWWVISVSDRTIITLSLGLAANGIYAVASKYAAIFSSLFFIFSMAFTESASMHIKAKDSDKSLSETNSASLRLFGSLGLLLIAGAPIIFSLLVGKNFQGALQYVPVLIVAAFFNAMVGIYSAIYVAKKMTKQVATTSIAAAVINVVLTLVGIRYFGIWAAAGATAVAYAAMVVFRHYDLKKYVSITYERYLFVKLAASYAVVICLFYLGGTLAVGTSIIIAALVAVLFNISIAKSLYKTARKR